MIRVKDIHMIGIKIIWKLPVSLANKVSRIGCIKRLVGFFYLIG